MTLLEQRWGPPRHKRYRRTALTVHRQQLEMSLNLTFGRALNPACDIDDAPEGAASSRTPWRTAMFKIIEDGKTLQATVTIDDPIAFNIDLLGDAAPDMLGAAQGVAFSRRAPRSQTQAY